MANMRASIGIAAAILAMSTTYTEAPLRTMRPVGVLRDPPRMPRAGRNKTAPQPEPLIRVPPTPKKLPVRDAIGRKIEGMTNWQRKQWAKAGYPAHRVSEFLAMRRG